MEFNKNFNKKKSTNSITHKNINHKLFKFDNSNSNSDFSSVSKKTGAFEDIIFNSGKGKMFSTKINKNNLSFSIQNNVAIRSSCDFSIKDIKAIKEKNGFILTNINISIDNPNPNFSIQNIENNKSFSINGTNINNNLNSNSNINNKSLISFKGSNLDSEIKSDENRKIISSIYADYLENKSNSEVISNNNCKNDPKINKFNEFINKNKILKYEFTKGYISGFSAYTYQNEENINKSKLSININVDKVSTDGDNNNLNEDKGNYKNHLINYFSLFCGDRKDDDDSLTKFLKNNFKDTLLEDKEIISNTTNAIKNSFIKCEIKYINYFLKGIQKDIINSELDLCNMISKIQSCSIIIILIIDDIIYISNIGKLNSILSSNLSRRIEYLSKDDNNQEKYQNHIEKKRKSLNSLLNSNNNYLNELNNSKSNLYNENNNILNKIINYKYEFIRVFPGRKLYDILLNYNNNSNNNLSNKSLSNKRNSEESKKHSDKNVKINNFIKESHKKVNKNVMYRRASLGPFFKISSKNENYNPKRNYRKSCAKADLDTKSQVIKILSSYPDMISFKYKNNKHDFIFVGCKIIFETLTYDKICKSIYETMKKCIKKHRSFELFLGCVIKDIIKMCITAGIKSSISCLFLCFNSIKQLYLKQDIEQIKNVIVPLCLTYTNHEKYEIYDDLLIHDFIDIDKSNNYYDIIDDNINNIIKTNGHLIDIENNLSNTKNENDKKINENNDKIKNPKKHTKKCCCFC